MRDTDPFREMYLKIYKAIKHTLVRTVLCTHACLQKSVMGQVTCPVGNSWRTVRRPQSGEPSRDTLQLENTMQVTTK